MMIDDDGSDCLSRLLEAANDLILSDIQSSPSSSKCLGLVPGPVPSPNIPETMGYPFARPYWLGGFRVCPICRFHSV